MDYTLHPTVSQYERGALRACVKFPAENVYYFLSWLPENPQIDTKDLLFSTKN